MSNKNHVSNVKKGEAWGGHPNIQVLTNPEVNSQSSSDIL